MMRRTPMNRGTAPLKAKKRWKPRYKPESEREGREYALACYGEPCYLRIDRICTHANVVPCHSNQIKHGKGKGLKAKDEFTVPGCECCHYELDQGRTLTKDQRRDIWDGAYLRWAPRRAKKMGIEHDSAQGRLEEAQVPEDAEHPAAQGQDS